MALFGKGGTPRPRMESAPKTGGGGGGGGMGGMFGRIGRWLTPERMQVIGHTLQEIDGQTGALDNFLAQRSQEQDRTLMRQRMQMQMAREDDAWKREMVDEAQLQAWVETLSPEQREYARVNPRAAYDAFMAARLGDGGWQHGQGYSHLWRPNPDGTVTRGDPLPLRPRAGGSRGGVNSAPALPDGFEWE